MLRRRLSHFWLACAAAPCRAEAHCPSLEGADALPIAFAASEPLSKTGIHFPPCVFFFSSSLSLSSPSPLLSLSLRPNRRRHVPRIASPCGSVRAVPRRLGCGRLVSATDGSPALISFLPFPSPPPPFCRASPRFRPLHQLLPQCKGGGTVPRYGALHRRARLLFHSGDTFLLHFFHSLPPDSPSPAFPLSPFFAWPSRLRATRRSERRTQPQVRSPHTPTHAHTPSLL